MDDSRKKELITLLVPLIESLAHERKLRVLSHFDISSHGSLTKKLEDASDESLLALAESLDIFDLDPTEFMHIESPAANPLLVFASHLHLHQAFVGAVEEYLKKYGVELFVAHKSITPDAIWRQVIVEKLDAAHAGVAFLHSSFGKSDWCSQEVGWLMGRHVRVISLFFSEAPEAFLGERQAIPATNMSVEQVGEAIMDFLTSIDEIRSNLIDSLLNALNVSTTFAQTELIWLRLRGMVNLTVGQCAVLMDALETNSQVYGPRNWAEGRTYREIICDFLESQPGFVGVENRVSYFRANRMDDGF
ncbi:MAG: toll/interleukin-1 receptor domain-containing protein [Actinobacteria bacterium]|nr:toll/interleukin-1 receptor domain-containing protein [Actinomycetota bacterium]